MRKRIRIDKSRGTRSDIFIEKKKSKSLCENWKKLTAGLERDEDLFTASKLTKGVLTSGFELDEDLLIA